jgi:photosystem II stability/assembly factor-like uncharacterized protein
MIYYKLAMKKIILLFSIFALFSVRLLSQGFTPFVYQTPTYGSHAVKDLKWITSTKFIAVGDAGAMLLTNDDGSTWQRIEPFTEQMFRKVFVKDSLTMFAIASHDYGLGECYKSTDAGYTWTLIHANANSSFRDIHFPNDSVGYIVSYYGKVTKTTDGGVTWNESGINTILGTYFNAVHFLNSDTGFIGKATTNAPMFRTDNGGLTWTQVYGYLGQACYNIQFLNDTLGYAGAYNSRIYRTINGGLTWSQQTTFQTNEEVIAMSFSSLTQGVAVTDSYVYRTNNGTTWSGPFLSGFNFKSAAFSPTGTIILGDSYGGLHRASSFGTTYININAQTGLQTFKKVGFSGTQNGWVVGDGSNVLKTVNGGLAWTKLSNAPYSYQVADMQVLNATIMLYVNDEGKVISTSNGGTTFTTTTVAATQALNAMSFPSAMVGYVVGNNGVAFKTTNGGTSYSAINTGITVNHVEVHFPSVNTGYVVSSWGELKKTTNGGSSWTNLSPSGMSYIKKIFFINDNYGVLVNDNGLAFRTLDGGATFAQVGQTCLQNPFDMQFINDSTGFVVGSFVNAYCDISFTTDSGNTWKSIELPFEYAGWGVHAIDTANIYLVGQNQTIIRIGTGGLITELSPDEMSSPNFTIFPNPTNGQLAIENNSDIYSVKVFDVMGREVNVQTEQQTKLHKISLHAEQLTKGIYFVQINNGALKKFIKE